MRVLIFLAMIGCGQETPLISNADEDVTEGAASSGSFDADRITTLLGMGAATLPYLFSKPSLAQNGWDAGTSATTTGNFLSFVVDGDNYRSTLLALIEGAETSIWINIFEWQHESTATEIADALIAAADRGVSVNIVVDNRGSSSDFTSSPVPNHTLMQRMSAAGCEVRAVRYSGYRVNHRKLFLFDGTNALVMGANLGGNYLLPLSEGWTYHDAGMLVAGPAVADIARVFLDSYQRSGGSGLSAPAAPAPVLGSYGAAQVQVLAHNGGGDRNIEREMVERIDQAHARVVLANGFGMSNDIRSALIRARGRGVAVTWLWGHASHDTALMAQASFSKLRKAGVSLRRYARPLHMKAYIFDDILIIGSANLDGFSSWLNDEVALQISGGSVANDFYTQVLGPDIAASGIITGNVTHAASWRDRLVQSVLEPIID